MGRGTRKEDHELRVYEKSRELGGEKSLHVSPRLFCVGLLDGATRVRPRVTHEGFKNVLAAFRGCKSLSEGSVCVNTGPSFLPCPPSFRTEHVTALQFCTFVFIMFFFSVELSFLIRVSLTHY